MLLSSDVRETSMVELMNLFVNDRFRCRWEKSKNGEPLLLSNNLFILNTTAFEVLQAYKERGVEGALTYFRETYPDVPETTLREDIEKIVAMLKKWRILVENKKETELPLAPSFMEMVESVFENTLSAPLHVACLVTYSCNAKCPHCYAVNAPQRQELSTEDWKKIVDQLVEMNVFSITFTGGEPLLRKDLDDLVQYASLNGLSVGIDTNAYFLTKERIETLVSKGCLGFEISLDGSCPKVHDTYRGLPGSFSRAVRALSDLLSEPVNLGVLTAVTVKNLDDIGNIIDLVAEIGVRRHSILRLRHVSKEIEELEPDPEGYIKLLQLIFRKQQDMKKPFIYPDVPARYYQESIGLDSYEELKKYNCIRPCEAGSLTCAVSPYGDLLPCNMSSLSLGNVRETPMKVLWESLFLQKLRRVRMNQGEPCNHCDLNTVCKAGCKALPAQIRGNGFSSDPVCFSCFSWKYGGCHG